MLAALSVCILGCGVHLYAPPDTAQDYLAYAAFESPDHLGLLLHWPERRMPLKVYLPPPPAGWFAQSDAVVDATHRAVTDWTDAGGPGVPSFSFVAKAGDADIPIMWADVSPSWEVAHCMIQVNFPTRHFVVENVLLTAWYRNRGQVPVDDLHRILRHEIGHALGIAGHSPNPEDVMYAFSLAKDQGLTDRDRETLRKLYAKPNGTVIAGVRRTY
jgi:predicted Zn-dependent protease